MFLVSISQGSLWHYLPLKPKQPDQLRFEWERGWGEFSPWFSICYDKYLKKLWLNKNSSKGSFTLLSLQKSKEPLSR